MGGRTRVATRISCSVDADADVGAGAACARTSDPLATRKSSAKASGTGRPGRPGRGSDGVSLVDPNRGMAGGLEGWTRAGGRGWWPERPPAVVRGIVDVRAPAHAGRWPHQVRPGRVFRSPAPFCRAFHEAQPHAHPSIRRPDRRWPRRARSRARRPPAGNRHGGGAAQSGNAQRRPGRPACLPPQGSLQWRTVMGHHRGLAPHWRWRSLSPAPSLSSQPSPSPLPANSPPPPAKLTMPV